MDKQNERVHRKIQIGVLRYIMKKNIILFFIFGFFLVIFALRLADSFILRTDQGPIGELFTHKLAGIVLLVATISFLHLKWVDIGFNHRDLFRGILTGIAVGGCVFLIAYNIEIIIAITQGKSPSLQFYVTSYNVTGNNALETNTLFILICIAGNTINVIMENGIFSGLFITMGEKRFSFVKANLLSSLLFGLWHMVMPLRNYIDGSQSLMDMIITMLLFFWTTFLFSCQLGMQFKQASSLWDGMTVHFINNTSVNMFHVVYFNAGTGAGVESSPVLRITIAQTIMFAIITVRWFLSLRPKSRNLPY